MPDTLLLLPDSFSAGTTVKYTRTLPGFSAADGWALTLYLAGAGAASFVGTPNGTGWDVVLTAVQTALLPAGQYRWIERVTKASDSYDAASGTVVVTANLATAAPGSLQTWEEKELVEVEKAIDQLLKSGITSYQIGSRAATKQDLEKLMALRNSLLATIRAQRTGLIATPIRFRFTGTAHEL
jgi:hypothetical protein